jgi:YidC/Oxa1 family membrane protein insertase
MTVLATNVIQSAFSPLISAFEWVLVGVHHVVGNWGLSIIGLTLIVRVIMVPLTLTQIRSMAKMRRIQPQMKELQERYKGDRTRQSEELMKLYKQYGVNPFASCLPLILQLPVFISLFYMLRTNLKQDICGSQLVQRYNALNHTAIVHASKLPGSFVSKTTCHQLPHHAAAKFLFINDVTAKATGAALIVLIILYVASQMGASLEMTVTADPTQRKLMLALPLFFVLLIFSFPAGLLVYWITTNIWTFGQAMVVQRTVNKEPPPEPPKGTGGGKSKASEKPSPNGGGKGEKALAAVGGRSGGPSASGSTPPPSPRKRKKRSGRRR